MCSMLMIHLSIRKLLERRWRLILFSSCPTVNFRGTRWLWLVRPSKKSPGKCSATLRSMALLRCLRQMRKSALFNSSFHVLAASMGSALRRIKIFGPCKKSASYNKLTLKTISYSRCRILSNKMDSRSSIQNDSKCPTLE